MLFAHRPIAPQLAERIVVGGARDEPRAEPRGAGFTLARGDRIEVFDDPTAGSLAATGKVTLRTSFSVSELPPEITDGREPSESTLDYVRAFGLTMTFSTNGNERHARLAVGDDCEILLESKSTFKPAHVATSPTSAKEATTSTKPVKAEQPKPKQGARSDDSRSARQKANVGRASADDDSPKPAKQLPDSGRRIGDECSRDDQCVSNWCTGDHCTHKTGSQLPKGEHCDADNQCLSNHCYDSTCQAPR